MSLSLPATPSLEHLKKQAKKLLQLHQKGDPAVCSLLIYLHRFQTATEAEMLSATVSLQEIQFCLARTYNFENWQVLVSHVDRERTAIESYLFELRHFLNKQGQIKQWPAKRKKQIALIKYMATKFDQDQRYSEQEVNDILNRHHSFNDPAILRRALIEYGFLERKKDGSEYWKQ